MKLVEALTGKLGEQPKSSTKGDWIGAGPTMASTDKKYFTKRRPFQHGTGRKAKQAPVPRALKGSGDNEYSSHIL